MNKYVESILNLIGKEISLHSNDTCFKDVAEIDQNSFAVRFKDGTFVRVDVDNGENL